VVKNQAKQEGNNRKIASFFKAMNMNNIDIESFINEIQVFNNNEANLACDYLVRQNFPDNFAQINPNGLATQVILIDGLWQTRLFQDAGATESIILALRDNWPEICNCIAQLNENSITENPEVVSDVAEYVFGVILNIGQGHVRHYSFTTKFFHWCTCTHFPIYDANALNGITRFLQDNQAGDVYGIVQMVPNNWTQVYSAWVHFYSDLLDYLDAHDYVQILVEADNNTQANTNPALLVDNSLLRILDKVFYMNRGERTLILD
jgi:hypothetical protein